MMDCDESGLDRLEASYRAFSVVSLVSLDGKIEVPGYGPDADIDLMGLLHDLQEQLDSGVQQILRHRGVPSHPARWRPSIDERIGRLLDSARGVDAEGVKSVGLWRRAYEASQQLARVTNQYLDESR
jgi:hypothetical protein